MLLFKPVSPFRLRPILQTRSRTTMKVTSQFSLLLSLLPAFTRAQNCPLHGPAYPAVADLAASTAIQTAKNNLDKLLAEALASGQLDNSTSTFSIAVFSTDTNNLIYEYHHGAADLNITLGSDTIYRVGSISKLVTVYTILSKLSDKYWDEPVTKFVPELSRLAPPASLLDGVDWSEVTLGALAGQMSGIGRDYALGDLSATLPGQTVLPGLPPLEDSELVRCGSNGYRPCTRSESFAKLLIKPAVSATYQSAIYSNVGFQLLAYAVENITGQPFSSLVESQLVKPLNLTRTFLSQPANDTNAVVVDGYDLDIGDEGPAGAYYLSLSDLSTVGRSILRSTILPQRTTRKWLHPNSHTSSLLVSVGKPWEIFRQKVATTTQASNNKTRVADLYTKSGGIQAYIAHMALSPDHGIGISILSAGGEGGTAGFFFLQALLYKTWLEAAESAAREAAGTNFGGVYESSGPSKGHKDNSTVEFGLDESGEPGLLLTKLVNNGTDMLASFGAALGLPEGMKLGAWLYPTVRDGKRVAFRAVFGALGVESTSEEACLSWGSVDQLRYGGHALDSFVFEVDRAGKAVEVRVEGLKKSFKKRRP
ncbi:beta-lactamase/transpeptidase-like protein [Cladorrhinum sp. PSN259]|nr:beta-lactamase/transpeptidase-like protein [Cladorrhinum sp. PSN259]